MNFKSKSLGRAGIFAYILIVVNTVSGFVLGPYLLGIVGEVEYGVYTTILSFSATLTIVDIGVTQTLIRYIANYRASGKDDFEVARVCNTVKLINGVIVLLGMLVSIGLYANISRIYASTFSVDELELAKPIFLVAIVSIITTLIINYYSGIIAGYGYFAFLNISKTIRLVMRFILSIAVISITHDIVWVAVVDAAMSVLFLVVYILYVKKYIDLPKVKGIVKHIILREMFAYTILVFIQNLVDQVNNNLDNVLIGSLVGSGAVTVYSFGLTIFHMFQNLSTSISQMLIPYMSEKIALNVENRELEDELIKIGRIQYIVIGAAIFGFVAVGREFVTLWLGKEYLLVWSIALILMFGGMIPLVQNGAIAILKAKNKIGFRTVMLVTMAIVNAIATYFLVKNFGFQYAAVGTSVGFILINTIVMDIYYYKKLHLNMLRVLKNILKRTTICNIIAMLFARIVLMSISSEIWGFIAGICVYLLLYALLLWKYGLLKEEKDYVVDVFIRRKNGDQI